MRYAAAVAGESADRLAMNGHGPSRRPRRLPNRPTTEDAPCFHAFSSIGRSSLRCCRSSSRWPAASPCGCCRSPSIRRSRRPPWRSRPPIPAPTRRSVADTVAAPIEQQVNGVEGMLYMSSQCTNDGTYTLTVTFKLGIDLNMAQVLVQNRVAMAQPILPDLVNRKGVTVKKKSPTVLMIVNLFSPPTGHRGPQQSVPEQLRHHPDPRRAGPAARRGRHHLSRPARLQHAALAGPAEDGQPRT